MSNKQHIISLTRKRLIAFFINLIITIILMVVLNFIVFDFLNQQNISINGLFTFILIILIILLSIYLHFGLLTKFTKGYTIGGFLLGIKIVKLDNSPLNSISLIKRLYDAITYTHSELFEKIGTKVNSLGQLFYDKKYHTTVIKRGGNIPSQDNVEEYIHSYLKEIILGFIFIVGLLKTLKYLSK